MNITKYLNTNILNIKNRLNIENNYDIIFKNFKISNINACLVTVDGLTDSTLLQKILENLETHVTLSDKFTIEEVESKIPYYEIDIKDTFEDIETAILSGVKKRPCPRQLRQGRFFTKKSLIHSHSVFTSFG